MDLANRFKRWLWFAKKLFDLMYTGYVVVYVKDGQILEGWTLDRQKIEFIPPKDTQETV